MDTINLINSSSAEYRRAFLSRLEDDYRYYVMFRCSESVLWAKNKEDHLYLIDIVKKSLNNL